MGKALLVIAPENFRDEELFHTQAEIEAAGHSTAVASTTTGQAKGARGGVAQSTVLVSNAKAADFDAIVFVGGNGVAQHRLYENESVLSLAREAASAGKVVAAICIGPRILAKAGLVKGKKVSCFADDETIAMLEEAGASVSSAPVEVDGKLVTANGPGAAREFGKRIAELL